jgi:hypothetical protein
MGEASFSVIGDNEVNYKIQSKWGKGDEFIIFN